MNLKKRGALGEGIFSIYRFLLVTLVAFVILGLSSIFYAYTIDIRDAESSIMAWNLVNCISKEGLVDLDSIGRSSSRILEYCGYDNEEAERFYVRILVSDSNNQIINLTQGDSGKLWVKEAFERMNLVGDEVGKYEPGYFPYQNLEVDYSVLVKKNGEIFPGKINVEVLVTNEEN